MEIGLIARVGLEVYLVNLEQHFAPELGEFTGQTVTAAATGLSLDGSIQHRPATLLGFVSVCCKCSGRTCALWLRVLDVDVRVFDS